MFTFLPFVDNILCGGVLCLPPPNEDVVAGEPVRFHNDSVCNCSGLLPTPGSLVSLVIALTFLSFTLFPHCIVPTFSF